MGNMAQSYDKAVPRSSVLPAQYIPTSQAFCQNTGSSSVVECKCPLGHRQETWLQQEDRLPSLQVHVSITCWSDG